MIACVDLRLSVAPEICRSIVGGDCVIIPFYVGEFRAVCHQTVHHAHYKVLHFWVAEVKTCLCAATLLHRLHARVLQEPVGVFVIKLACLPVTHLRLYPDTKLQSVLLGIVVKMLQAVRQLTTVHVPVAQRSVILVAVILVACEPSVIHDEQLTSELLHTIHELMHLLLRDVEVHALPRVEQHVAHSHAVMQLILSCPPVHVTADATLALIGVCESELRCAQRLVCAEVIGSSRLVYAGKEMEERLVVWVERHAHTVVSAPAQGSANGASHGLTRLSVEREHHLRVVGVCVASAVAIAYHLHTCSKRLLIHLTFVTPLSVLMR